MSARSGLRNVDPTGGGLPPGRNSFRVEVNCENRDSLAAVWSWKVWSTTKPSRASRAAGWIDVGRVRVPQRSSARCQVARVPGTPTETPLLTWSLKL